MKYLILLISIFAVFKPVQSLKVNVKHTDHSFDIQFEGPGWESDKIGCRNNKIT